MGDHTIMVIWVMKIFFCISSSVYSYHPFLISSASVRSITFLSFIVPIFAWNVLLLSWMFLKRSLVFPILLFSSISSSKCMSNWTSPWKLSVLKEVMKKVFTWHFYMRKILRNNIINFLKMCPSSDISHSFRGHCQNSDLIQLQCSLIKIFRKKKFL